MKTEKIIKRLLCLLVFFIFIYCAGSLKAATLNVTLKNRSDSRVVTNLTFRNSASAKAAAPWVMADQYIEVEYAPDTWASYDWGLTIVTDNTHDISANIAGKPTDPGLDRLTDPGPDRVFGTPDDGYSTGPDGIHGPSDPGPDGRYGTADDISDDDNRVTYGGLIDRDYVTRTDRRNQDPNFKASLCWQVRRDRFINPGPDRLYGTSDDINAEGTGTNALNGRPRPDDCVRGRLRSGTYTESYNYNSDWAYIIDKSDSQVNVLGGPRVPAYDTTGLFYDTGTRSANKYFLVAWGTATTRAEGTWGVLAQHPVVSGFPDSPNSKVPNDTDNDRDMDGVLDYIDRNRNGIPEEAERNDFDIRPVDPSRIGIWGTPDIVIYVGARFCSDRYISGTRVSVLLPPGSYASTIYLELWHF